MEQNKKKNTPLIRLLQKSLYKSGYLLIVAAWLFTISFIFSNYYHYSISPARAQKQLENFISAEEKQIATALRDSAFVRQVLGGDVGVTAFQQYKKLQAGLFIYSVNNVNNTTLLYWNNNKILPDDKDLSRPDGAYPSIHANGYFELIKKSFIINGTQIIAAGMVPVYWNYGINNKYIRSRFPVKNLDKRYTVNTAASDLYIKNGDGKILFSLAEKEPNAIAGEQLPVIFKILALIFFLIYINALSLDIANARGWVRGFGFLFCTLFILRFISYKLPFPFYFRGLSLFDSTIYASNFLHPTLGDLFINSILVYWLVSFAKFSVINSLQKREPAMGRRAWVQTVLMSVVLIIIAFTSAGIIRSLINDSQISFDVTNFFSLNIFSFLSFIILCFIILSFFYLSHVILLFLYKAIDIPMYVRYAIVAACGLAYLSFDLHNTATTGNILVLLWLLIYMALMEMRKVDIFIPILRSAFFIIWIIFFAASISALIIYQNSIINEQKRIREAEKLANEADQNAQYIFSTGIADIDSAFLSGNLNRIKSQTSNRALKDSLSSRYLSINSDAYDTHIYTFDENDVPLYNDDSTSVFSLRTLIGKGRETLAPDLFYYEKDVNVFSFIYQKELHDKSGNIKGYFFIVGDPKKYQSQTVYPELFMPGNAEEEGKITTYAIYNRGRLVESSGDYNFLSNIPVSGYPKVLFQNIDAGEHIEFRYNAGNGKLIITIHSESVYIEFITLFAYLFGSFLLIIVSFQLGRLLVRFKFNAQRMRKGMVFNIRNQIQATIGFISIFSFFIIGISTITFYINRFKQTNRERLIKSMKVFANEIGEEINSQHFYNSLQNIHDSLVNAKLQLVIKNISEIQDVDANFFDLRGRLQATTQPEIYKRQILSRMMDAQAYYKLAYQREIQLIQEEKVSGFVFLSIYVPVYDLAGKPYAYLNIPYLNTQKELNQEISSFLVTLINLNAFIFLIAGAISLVLTNRITNSFSLIADKMKKINIGSDNEKVKWNYNDEIGTLVNEYNKMVKKLEESAQALAKSEREGAWREMARQVAHEIKNPLTPMKLSIQYLQRAIQDNKPNTPELSKKVTATLVEQIDQLAKIASDFSQFANITKVNTEIFNVNEIIKSLIDLYSSNEGLKITYQFAEEACYINADRGQMNRLFTNLFQNAIEASEQKETVIINIDQRIENNMLLTRVSDEGSGIPAEKQNKIFTPNFTTKSSGTGLGLAISKGIVENAFGKIWFDTQDKKGTTFHILLPLVNV